VRNKIIELFAFLSFWLTIIALFCVAGDSDVGNATNSETIKRGLICLAILAVDAIIITVLTEKGDWKSNRKEDTYNVK